jgi:antidote-toxin recognition MazE-like antitoxin
MASKAVKKKAVSKTASADRRRDAVRRHRVNMRKRGMRLLQLWVPDTDAPGFAEECRRQSLLVSRHPKADDQALDRDLEAWAAEVDKQLGPEK